MKTETPILIIGKNGKTGTRVNALLQAQGIPTRGVSRSTAPAFDWNHQETWAPALSGIKQAYVSYHPDLAIPSAEPAMRAFVEVAKQQGVEHIVLLSGRGEDGAIRAENVIKDSGLRWNVVRASWFFQNFSEAFLVDGIQQGNLVLPVGAVKEPFIDCDDIAEVAVAALTRPDFANRLFEVTGSELLTFADCVKQIADELGRPITYTLVPLEPYMAQLKEMGMSEDELWLLEELFTKVLDGRNSHISDGVQQALGREPNTFYDYVKSTSAKGMWSKSQAISA